MAAQIFHGTNFIANMYIVTDDPFALDIPLMKPFAINLKISANIELKTIENKIAFGLMASMFKILWNRMEITFLGLF